MRASPTSPEAAAAAPHGDRGVERPAPGGSSAVAAGAAAVLVGSLFLHWYGYPDPDGTAGTVDVTGWEVMSATDVLLAGLAGVVVLVAVLGALRAELPAARYAAGLAMGMAGLAALALVVVRLAFPPGAPAVLGAVGVDLSATRQEGVFVALAAALVMAAAGVVAAGGVVLEGVSRTFERVDRGL